MKKITCFTLLIALSIIFLHAQPVINITAPAAGIRVFSSTQVPLVWTQQGFPRPLVASALLLTEANRTDLLATIRRLGAGNVPLDSIRRNRVINNEFFIIAGVTWSVSATQPPGNYAIVIRAADGTLGVGSLFTVYPTAILPTISNYAPKATGSINGGTITFTGTNITPEAVEVFIGSHQLEIKSATNVQVVATISGTQQGPLKIGHGLPSNTLTLENNFIPENTALIVGREAIVGFTNGVTGLMQQPPANEINCFANFNYNNTGNKPYNAYLLSLLVHWNSPTTILNNYDDNSAPVKGLYLDDDKFLAEYKKKTGHFFDNAVFTKVSYNDHAGYDPEAVFISTPNYIIIVFRGTDRIAMKPGVTGIVDNAIEFTNYSVGEWVKTTFDAYKINAPFGLNGQVHRGFSNSLTPMLARLVDTLTKYNYQNKKIWITGNSLGSAHAQLCGAYLKKQYGIPVQCVYAYASPAVGDANFTTQLDALFTGHSLQRFDFMDDPATLIPTYLMGYARAGTRNHYTSELANSYTFNANEVSNDLRNISVFLCNHNTHWYARAAYNELTASDAAAISKVPAPPAKPTQSCNSFDYDRVNNKSPLEIARETITNIAADIAHNISVVAGNIAEGIRNTNLAGHTYKISCLKGGKSLALPGRCDDQDGCPLQLWDDDGGHNMRFEVFQYGLGLGFKVKNTSKVLDVLLESIFNGAEIKTYGQHPFFPLPGNVTPNNQIFFLHKVGNNKYVIQNERSGKVLDANTRETGINGCAVQQWTYTPGAENQTWVFTLAD
jgi:hypothetical protein